MSEKKVTTIKLDKNNRPIVRSRTFEILLYVENNELDKVIKTCIEKEWAFIYALHDKDVLEDGKKTKDHIHFIIKCKNAIWSTSLSKCLGIETTYIQVVSQETEMLGYLFHTAEPDKFQYDLSAIKGSQDLFERISIMYEKQEFNSTENDVIQYICNYIVDEYPFQIGTKTDKYYMMISYFIANGWYPFFKKNYFIIKELLFRVDNERNMQ